MSYLANQCIQPITASFHTILFTINHYRSKQLSFYSQQSSAPVAAIHRFPFSFRTYNVFLARESNVNNLTPSKNYNSLWVHRVVHCRNCALGTSNLFRKFIRTVRNANQSVLYCVLQKAHGVNFAFQLRAEKIPVFREVFWA